MQLVSYRVEPAIWTEAEGVDPRKGGVNDKLPVPAVGGYYTDGIAGEIAKVKISIIVNRYPVGDRSPRPALDAFGQIYVRETAVPEVGRSNSVHREAVHGAVVEPFAVTVQCDWVHANPGTEHGAVVSANLYCLAVDNQVGTDRRYADITLEQTPRLPRLEVYDDQRGIRV